MHFVPWNLPPLFERRAPSTESSFDGCISEAKDVKDPRDDMADGPLPLSLTADVPLGLESNPVELGLESQRDERFAELAPDLLGYAAIQTAELSEFFAWWV